MATTMKGRARDERRQLRCLEHDERERGVEHDRDGATDAQATREHLELAAPREPSQQEALDRQELEDGEESQDDADEDGGG